MRASARIRVLLHLLEVGQASQHELMESTGFRSSAIELVLRRLRQEEFITRSAACKPRLFGLTRKGNELAINLQRPTLAALQAQQESAHG